MNFHHQNEEGDGEVKNVTSGIPLVVTPQGVTSLIAVIGIIGTIFWTIADYRVNLSDISIRQNNMSERITIIEKKLDSLDNNGSRQVIILDATIKALKEQMETIKDSVDSVNGAIEQHNQSMYDLYKKEFPNKPMPRHHAILPTIPTPR